MAARQAREAQGKKPRGPPTPEPRPKDQYNFTDPHSRIMKDGTGFRQFLLRGAAKVGTEWTLVCLAYNLRRLHRLGAGTKMATSR